MTHAEQIAQDIVQGHMCIPSHVPRIAAIIQRAIDAELQAVVDKLPKYADTGELFVPSVDAAWIVENGRITEVYAAMWEVEDGWAYEVLGEYEGSEWVSTAAYSIREAAEAAKEANDG